MASCLAALIVALVALSGCECQGQLDGASGGNDDNCTCVPYYQCDGDNNIIQNGVGIIDIRGKGTCDHYLDVCCKAPVGSKLPEVTPSVPPSSQCGRRNPNGVAMRITGDRAGEAQFGEFPWMAAVMREDHDQGQVTNSYACGGALLHPQVVLTAAHCVASIRSDRLWVRLGEWDTQTANEPLSHQERRVAKVALHPDFRDDALYNDVALLTLETPVDLAGNIDVVCLPAKDAVFDGARCFASGWGKDVYGKEGRYQVILKKVELPVVPRDDCLSRLRTTRLGKHFVLHDSFMCAGGEPGHDTCQGDGGSPLVCPLSNDPGRYQQVGIVAWGIGCGGDSPAVYANVAKFRDWIDTQFIYANLNTTVYSN